MKISSRRAIVIGILLLGCAVVVLIISGGMPQAGTGSTGGKASAKPGNIRHRDGLIAKAGTEAETEDQGNAMHATRSKLRPVETDLDRLRRERDRIVDRMQILERAGLGERHPSKVKVVDDLRKVEADIAGAGGAPPSNP
ncbi:hypothetical protein OVA24_06590 [Luteolibacter sp. SL250]|uniref:hypothetical protein n=1 Tax=Luteolibacter sp. SL250 TaxID=2995170 RepID=UPI00226FEE22|nr:hypothetical protein [Luteolibacter sp. SL250]WAC21049.1 hypothetical protein OVA24_06590 [Luteolibacter sp. SL250]